MRNYELVIDGDFSRTTIGVGFGSPRTPYGSVEWGGFSDEIWRGLLVADRFPQFARDGHRLQGGVDDLGRARLLRRVLRLGLEQLGVREDHAELIIQFMQQLFRVGGHCTHDSNTGLGCGVIRRVLGPVRLAPQRIHKDPDAAAGGAQILHLVRRDPVIDRAAADADHFARLHNADSLPFHWGCLQRVYRCKPF